MTNREIVAEYNEDAVVFTEDWYDDAIIAVTTEGNAIYDYDRLAELLMEHDKMTYEDAVEWIEYNMIRGAAYMGQYRPFVAYTMKSMREDYE
jgi:hypothetical protein